MTGRVWAGLNVEARDNVTISGGILSVGSVTLLPGTVVTGDVWSGLNLNLIGSARVSGNATTVGFLDMKSGSEVEGNVFVGTNLLLVDGAGVDEIGGNATVRGNVSETGQIAGDLLLNSGSMLEAGVTYGGTLTTGASTPLPTGPGAPVVEVPSVADLARDLTAECMIGAAQGTTAYATDTTLEPGIYGNIQVTSGALLHLLPGNYVFAGLDISTGDLRFSEGTQPQPQWDLSTCGEFLGGSDHRFYLSGTTNRPRPSQVILYSQSTSESCDPILQ